MPIIYPSHYLKKHNLEYYQRLYLVRTDGDFEGWMIYYLTAVLESAKDAYSRAKEIETLEAKINQKIQAELYLSVLEKH